MLLCRKGRFIFKDNLSSNGSVLNGQDVDEEVDIKHGDCLNLGGHSYIFVSVHRAERSIPDTEAGEPDAES